MRLKLVLFHCVNRLACRLKALFNVNTCIVHDWEWAILSRTLEIHDRFDTSL